MFLLPSLIHDMYLYEQSGQHPVSSNIPTILFRAYNQSSFHLQLFRTSLIKLSKNFAIAFVILILIWLCIYIGHKLVKYYSLIVANDRNEINQNQSNHLSFYFYSNG